MSEGTFHNEVGALEKWRQIYLIGAPDPQLTDHVVQPTSGVVIIEMEDTDGTVKWWNGTAFTATLTELATTIVGKESRYDFRIPEACRGKRVRFYGWVIRNGFKSKRGEAFVDVSYRSAATLKF